MKKRSSKIFAMLLVICMVVSLVPMTAYADELEKGYAEVPENIAGKKVSDIISTPLYPSDYCADIVRWEHNLVEMEGSEVFVAGEAYECFIKFTGINGNDFLDAPDAYFINGQEASWYGGEVAGIIIIAKEGEDEVKPNISIENVTAAAGSTVNVTVSVEKNPGIFSVSCNLIYSKSVFTLAGITKGDIFDEFTSSAASINAGNTEEDSFKTGTFFTLSLKVNDSAAPGVYPIKVEFDSCSNVHDSTVVLVIEDGSVEVTGSVAPPQHTHSLTFVSAKAATCVAAGNVAYYSCSGCGKLFSDAAGNNEITNVVVPATGIHTGGKATCTAKAVCDVCHQQYGELAAHDLTYVPAKAATCVAAGNVAYYSCKTCGKLFSDAAGKNVITNVTVAATGKHTGGKATCTAKAICDVCHQPYGELVAHNYSGAYVSDATGHWKVCSVCGTADTKSAHTPNMSAPTETKDQVCSVCGYVIAPATGHIHNLKLVPAKAATCVAAGNVAYYTCSGCDKLFSDAAGKTEITNVVVAATGIHTGGKATCTAKAVCDVCHQQYGELAAHDLTFVPAKAATCVAAGNVAYYSCKTCGKLFSDAAGKNVITNVTVAATGIHTGGKATCTAKAVCDVCHQQYGELAAHDLTFVPAKAATCVAAGNVAYYSCKTCGKLFSDAAGKTEITNVTVAATGVHTGGKATCTAKAICDVCHQPYGELAAHNYSGAYVSDATGHWKVCSVCGAADTKSAHTPNMSAPTETQDQVCTVCGYVIAPATGHIHNLKLVPAKAATCVAAGNIAYYTCSGCDKLFSDADGKNVITNVVIPATGAHTGGTATCKEKAICDVCHQPYGEYAAHTLTLVPAKAATCVEAGSVAYYSCGVCGKKFADAAGKTEIANITVPATGVHTGGKATCTAKAICDVCHQPYGDFAAHELTLVPAKAATCVAEGSVAYYSCGVCGKKFADAAGKNEITNIIVAATGIHTGGTATCKDLAICDVCHQPYGELAAHNYVDGVCVVCGHEEEIPVFEEDILVDTVTASCGDKAAVNVTYVGDAAISSVRFVITSKLPIASIESNYSFEYNPENGKIVVYGAGGAAISGKLFTLNYDLDVDPWYANGTYEITLEGLDATNTADERIVLDITNGAIIIDNNYLPGDANLDGRITNADAIAVARYLVKLVEFNEAQLEAADVNDDDVVNNVDLVMIARKIVQG